MHALITALVLAASARAVQFTYPNKDQKVELGSSAFVLKWTTVSSDPASASLQLVNNVGGHTPFSKTIGPVDLTKGSFTVDPIPGLTPETGYQFNLVGTAAESSGILAQSEQFEVVPGSASPGGSTTPPGSGSGTSTSTTTTTMSPPTGTGTMSSHTPAPTDSDGAGAGDHTPGSANATTTATGGSRPTGSATTPGSASGTASGSLPTKSSNSAGSKVMAGSALALAVGVAFALLA